MRQSHHYSLYLVGWLLLSSATATAESSPFQPRSVVPRVGAKNHDNAKKNKGKAAASQEPKWSWEEQLEKNVPLKIGLGLSLFAATSLPSEAKQTIADQASQITSKVRDTVVETTQSIQSTLQSMGNNAVNRELLDSVVDEIVAHDDALSGGTASIPELTFNLVKAIVGAGVLSLPAGIVAFGSAPSAVLPAIALVVLMGSISGVGFSWIAQTCAKTGALSYREAWARSVSPGTAWMPSLFQLLKTLLACLSYSMVLADSLRSFVPIEGRTEMLWSVTAVVLLPLCWLKDLKSLVPFSIVGVFGMVYTALAMTYRYFQGAYLPDSPILSSMAPKFIPSFGNDGWEAVFRPQSIVFVSMLSTAFMCHFNSPKFYKELKDNTPARFNRLVAFGFGVAILLSALVAGIGFATFGSSCDGFVLNNYAQNDFWIYLSRMAVSASLITSYPISFQGLRDGTLDMLRVPEEKRTNALLNRFTVMILLAVTVMATFLTDVSFVAAFGGATLGNALIYILPAIMHARTTPSAKIPAALLGGSGVILGIIGTVLTLKGAGGEH